MRIARLGFLIGTLQFAATAAVAQDTTAVPQDTSRAAPVMADTVRAIQPLAPFYAGPAGGFAAGVWEWSRDQFMNESAVTLGDLLERIPGILTLRSGLYLQPEAATTMGGTGNRLEVWLDGYVLDPLLESSFDIAKLELAQVEHVRVERRLGTIRVHIQTLMPADTRAFSLIEAGVGQPTANLFRGLLLAPKVLVGPLGLGIDRIDTRGRGGNEPADQFAGWVKSSFIRNGSGVQVEFRSTTTDRDPDVPWRAKYERADLIVRARARITPNLIAEVFGGRSRVTVDTTAAEVDTIPKAKDDNTQLGGRIGFSSANFWAQGAVRLRDAVALPKSQLDGTAGVMFGPVSATVEARQADWRDAGSATELSVRAEAAPFKALRIFGETTTSDRGVPYLGGAADSAAAMTSYKGYRIGGEANLAGITVGGALLHAETDSVTTFGLPFDRTPARFFGADATGWEVSGRAPLPVIKGLYATGNVMNWHQGNVTLYMPTRMYRVGAELHVLPLKSKSLEILARAELIYRGNMLAPSFGDGDGDGDGGGDGEGTEDSAGIVTLPAANYWDAFLMIRILDLRAFLRYEDLNSANVPEIPGRVLNGPRVFYGIKWQFWN